MYFEDALKRILNLDGENWLGWQPNENVSRQQWQEQVQELVEMLRCEFRRPVFGLSELEVTVCYHEPLEKFAMLVAERLGIHGYAPQYSREQVLAARVLSKDRR